ncbi:MAG: DUF6020 family protein [Lachnospiraceae bacterium]
MKHEEAKTINFWKTTGCLVLAFISTYFIESMLKVDLTNYFSNSILSLFVFIGIFLLYKKAVAKIDIRLLIISAVYGVIFSACMVIGVNVLTHAQTRINHLFVWIQILAETPLFMAAVIVIFRTVKYKEKCFSVSKIEKFMEQKFTIKKFFLISWILIFLAWIPSLIATYPGIYGYDSIYQLTYYSTGEISLHHPLVHTYLLGFCVWTLGNLFGDLKIGLLIYSLIQMLCLSGVFALICTYMKKRKCPAIINIIFLLLFIFLPTNVLMSFSATKDVLYTAFLSVVVLLFMQVAETPELLKKNTFCALLILFVFLQCIFRSQGIYVFLFGMIGAFVLWRKYWKRLLALLIICMVLYGVYSGPITTLCNGKEFDSIHEMMSVPCVQLSKAALDNESELTETEKRKIEQYIPNYRAYYSFESNADALKNTFNSELFKKHPGDFVKLWVSVGIKAPLTYIDAFARLTIGLWYPDMNYRDPEAWHPYWEYSSSKQLPEDIERVIVERDTPHCMEWLSYIYNEITYTNIYQKVGVISMLFSSGFICWIMWLYAGWCIYIKQYRFLVPLLLVFGVWLTTMLGPVILYRYIFPITVADIIFLGSVLTMKKEK